MDPGLTAIVPGSVAVHYDGHSSHWSVILDVRGDECDALFFTSNPEWASHARRATKDEIAMAGFVQTRPTYLAHVVRPSWDFQPMGNSYPDHWIEALKQEFRIQRVQQVQVSRCIEV